MDGDPVKEDMGPANFIELVDTIESEISLIDWGVHESSGIDRKHVHPEADKNVDARLRYWHPPMVWRSDWMPPIKLPAIMPPYKATLVK